MSRLGKSNFAKNKQSPSFDSKITELKNLPLNKITFRIDFYSLITSNYKNLVLRKLLNHGRFLLSIYIYPLNLKSDFVCTEISLILREIYINLF